MEKLICYAWIAFAVVALLFVLWCVDRWFASENDDRKRRVRSIKRAQKKAENRVWYIETRTGDAHADLIRVWKELDV